MESNDGLPMTSAVLTIMPFYDLATGARVSATRAQLSNCLKNDISISDEEGAIKAFVSNLFVEGAVDVTLSASNQALAKLALLESLSLDSKSHRCFLQKADPLSFAGIAHSLIRSSWGLFCLISLLFLFLHGLSWAF